MFGLAFCGILIIKLFYKQSGIVIFSCLSLSCAIWIFMMIFVAIDDFTLVSEDVWENFFEIMFGFNCVCIITLSFIWFNFNFHYAPRIYLSTFSYWFGRIFIWLFSFIFITILLFTWYKVFMFMFPMFPNLVITELQYASNGNGYDFWSLVGLFIITVIFFILTICVLFILIFIFKYFKLLNYGKKSR